MLIRIPRVVLPWSLLVLACVTAPLSGQAPSQRRLLVAVRDSLGRLEDPTVLRQGEAEMIARARQAPDDAMLHLRLGLVALRLGELGIRKAYDDAASEFQWATELQPRWPWGWYGLGLAELGVGDSEVVLVSGLQTMLGRDALTRSANAFARSAEVDPTFVEGVVELANTALRQRTNVRTEVALAALRRTARTPAGRHPDVLLARGRIERAVGSPDSAAAAFRLLLARDTADAGVRLEMARTGFLIDDPSATALWYGGLRRADTATLARYRQDLAYVMPDSLLVAFDLADPATRETLVREFWAVRDRAQLRGDGERLAEHYRRLDFAMRNYRLTAARRQYDIVERFRSSQDQLDDRGIVHVRHGAPDDRVSYTAAGVEPNETWRYRREEGDLLLHFVAREDVQDFRLVESAFDVLGFATTIAMRSTDEMLGEYEHLEGVIRTREGLDPTYRRLLGAGRGSAAGLLTEERAAGRRGMEVGTTTDSWPLRFRAPLPGTVDAVAVGTAAGGPLLHLAFAIPTTGLAAEPDGDTVTYEVRLRAGALSLDGVPVATLDTTLRVRRAEPLPDGEYLYGRVPVRVPAGALVVRTALETARGGLVTVPDTVRVMDPEPTRPALSDLAMGTRRIPLVWTPGGDADSAWFHPRAAFQATDPMELLVEVGGVAPLAPYRLEIAVRRPGGGIFRRLFGGGGTAVRVTFAAEHPGGVARVRRTLALDRLAPGAYELEVRLRVEGVDGEVRRTRTFTVVP
jgi:GWxTD domain-containing protein